MEVEPKGRARGGKARAESMSKLELSEQARKAASARWNLPRTEFEGDLSIPGIVPLSVANLDDGRRVITAKAVLESLGRPWKGSYQRTGLPSFFDAKNLEPFITDEVRSYLETIDYIGQRGQKITGYDADLLPQVCRVYLDANEAGAIKNKRQAEIVNLVRVIYHGLATHGIRRLIDDVTGYTQFKARSELQKILAAYVSPALLPWNPKFPDGFYEQLHRVRGWPYRPGNSHRNSYIGKLTKALIYEPLPNGVIQKLEEKNPYISEKKGRKYRHFQYLTEEIGNPHLEKQISIVTTLLTISDSWDEFLKHFSRAFPVRLGLFSLPPPPPEAAADDDPGGLSAGV